MIDVAPNEMPEMLAEAAFLTAYHYCIDSSPAVRESLEKKIDTDAFADAVGREKFSLWCMGWKQAMADVFATQGIGEEAEVIPDADALQKAKSDGIMPMRIIPLAALDGRYRLDENQSEKQTWVLLSNRHRIATAEASTGAMARIALTRIWMMIILGKEPFPEHPASPKQ